MTPNQPNSSNGAMGQVESSNRNSGGRGADTPASGLTNEPSVKSNLRKRELLDEHQLRCGSRKVTWPDAHGKDLAHVQEFHSRLDGQCNVKRNSCICLIQ
ncbi:hypothetical protein AAC387_Pa06g1122 [Persea americana]